MAELIRSNHGDGNNRVYLYTPSPEARYDAVYVNLPGASIEIRQEGGHMIVTHYERDAEDYITSDGLQRFMVPIPGAVK